MVSCGHAEPVAPSVGVAVVWPRAGGKHVFGAPKPSCPGEEGSGNVSGCGRGVVDDIVAASDKRRQTDPVNVVQCPKCRAQLAVFRRCGRAETIELDLRHPLGDFAELARNGVPPTIEVYGQEHLRRIGDSLASQGHASRQIPLEDFKNAVRLQAILLTRSA